MKFSIWLSALTFCLMSIKIFAQNIPLNEVRFKDISFGGSGCGVGTVAHNLSPDLSSFSLVFSEYAAEIGPNIPRSANRKFCNLIVNLQIPRGWSFSIMRVDYRGYVNIDLGVQGMQQSSYYFQGQRLGTRPFRTIFNGPLEKNYTHRDEIQTVTESWSPCAIQRPLILQTEVRLTSAIRKAQGIITTDSINGEVEHVYGLRWKRCPLPNF